MRKYDECETLLLGVIGPGLAAAQEASSAAAVDGMIAVGAGLAIGIAADRRRASARAARWRRRWSRSAATRTRRIKASRRR